MTAVASYSYLGASALTAEAGLTLQTSVGDAHPRFFSGFVTAAEPAALGLLAVAEVARTRYFQPVDHASLDPVVTGGEDRLRFESFSGCCGVYARMDLLPAALDGAMLEHGTTNVDVNPPLREALARVGGLDPLKFDVGADELVVSTLDGAVVEKKVPLPARWLRGFAEVQVIASGFEPRFEVDAVEAAAFLRRLPRGSDRWVLWVVPAGRGLRLTSRPVPGAVCLPGPGRLAALRPLLRLARRLRAYGPTVTAGTIGVPSTWELSLPELRLTLTLSPDPARGFSGEGAVLSALTGDKVIEDADVVSALLSWDPAIDVDALASAAALPAARVRAALTQLGTSGRVGYDVTEAAYFHRVLPYNAEAAARLNPRLAGARALVAAGAVTTETPMPDRAWVHSGCDRYLVRVADGHPVSCTCQWWAKHRGDRGPCKHLLAVTLTLSAEAFDEADTPVGAR